MFLLSFDVASFNGLLVVLMNVNVALVLLGLLLALALLSLLLLSREMSVSRLSTERRVYVRLWYWGGFRGGLGIGLGIPGHDC